MKTKDVPLHLAFPIESMNTDSVMELHGRENRGNKGFCIVI